MKKSHLIALVAVVVIASGGYLVWQSQQESTRRASSGQQTKQLLEAMFQFRSTHGDRWPKNLEELASAAPRPDEIKKLAKPATGQSLAYEYVAPAGQIVDPHVTPVLYPLRDGQRDY